jgi:hypothetical protein
MADCACSAPIGAITKTELTTTAPIARLTLARILEFPIRKDSLNIRLCRVALTNSALGLSGQFSHLARIFKMPPQTLKNAQLTTG